jgi:hypothetical protein
MHTPAQSRRNRILQKPKENIGPSTLRLETEELLL